MINIVTIIKSYILYIWVEINIIYLFIFYRNGSGSFEEYTSSKSDISSPVKKPAAKKPKKVAWMSSDDDDDYFSPSPVKKKPATKKLYSKPAR